MDLGQFDYCLPDQLIAKRPCVPREFSRMLVCDAGFKDDKFINFFNYLDDKDIIVVNNSKVMPIFLIGIIKNQEIKVTLHKEINSLTWLAFTRPSKKLNSGDEIYFSKKINAKVLEKRNFGEAVISFNCDDEDLNSYIQDQGKMPLPPYILKSRDSDSKDFIDYQTVYAKNFGSVAAPTAGLHFDHTIIKKLKDNNQLVEITLHVGSGTFQPIRDTIESHQMHSEYGIITEESASKILKCKKNGGRVISVGTTTLRLIETGSLKTGEIDSYEGETDIFIKPGFNFNTVDLLLTNFHLPKSTLLLLVSAFAGTEKIKKLYDYAINMKYRFFSYGDVTLLYRK